MADPGAGASGRQVSFRRAAAWTDRNCRCAGCGGNTKAHGSDQSGCEGWFPDWCITGGESGHGARPYCEDWARDLIAQCRAVKAAPFVKQMGSYYCFGDEARPHHRVYLNEPKGGDWCEWKDDLRVREFPEVRP